MADYVAPAGAAVDVTYPEGSQPHAPLTLTFDATAPPGSAWQPVSMHQTADGTWEPVEATTDGAGHITVVTDDFSLHLPSWVNPVNWFKSLVTAATSFFGGRSTPDPCPPTGQRPAPQWASLTGPSTGATHVCMFENTDPTGDRVEVQLRSNRGTYLVVSNPVGADYVWQAPRSQLATHIARNHFWVAADEWVIAPGDQMTYGYRRSATGGSVLVNVHANTATIEFSGLSALLGGSDVLGIYQFYTCFVGDPMNLTLVLESFADMVKCAITGGGELADGDKALAAVRNLYGPSIDNATLTEQAKLLSQEATKFKGWGRILALVGVAQAIFPVWTQMLDVAGEVAIPGAGDISLTFDPPTATVSPADTDFAWPYPTYFDVPQLGSEPVRGSGCGASGSLGDTIPNGTWNGYITTIGDGTLELDVDCVYYGESAAPLVQQFIDDHGREPANGTFYFPVNNTTKTRTVALSPGFVHREAVWIDGKCLDPGPSAGSEDSGLRTVIDSWVVIRSGRAVFALTSCPYG